MLQKEFLTVLKKALDKKKYRVYLDDHYGQIRITELVSNKYFCPITFVYYLETKEYKLTVHYQAAMELGGYICKNKWRIMEAADLKFCYLSSCNKRLRQKMLKALDLEEY